MNHVVPMSAEKPQVEAAQTIELPADVVDTIADKLQAYDEPTERTARGMAFDHLDRRTEFVTERDEQLVDALKRRL